MAAPEIQIRELDEHDVPLAARFYDDVLRPSFSGDELDGWTSLEAGLRGRRQIALRVAVALDDAGAPVGGLTAELFPNSGVLLIGYLAVRPDWRGRGIGSRLMTWASTRWYEDPFVVLVLGEVHNPCHDWNVPGEDARRRLRFFGRLGAQVLDVAFVQPALGPGQQRVPNFLLVVLAAKEAALVPPGQAVHGHVIDRFIREYFDFCEGPVSERPDPGLARLLASVLPAVRQRSLPDTSVG